MATEYHKKDASRKLKLFFEKHGVISYKKREIILHAEDTPSGVFYVKKGCVKLYALSKEGEELDLILFKAGNIFPLMWSINNTPNKYHLEAMTNVEMWRVPRENFLEFIKSNPDVLFELFTRLLFRFGGLLERMEHLVFGNAYQKAASILLILSQRFGKKINGEIVIQIPLAHKDIASLLGITRETATLELGKLERKGLIKITSKIITIKNPDKLKSESLLSP